LNIDEGTLSRKTKTDDNQSNIQLKTTTCDLFINDEFQSSIDNNYLNTPLPFVNYLSNHELKNDNLLLRNEVLTDFNQFGDDNISLNSDYLQTNCISTETKQLQHNNVVVKDIFLLGNDIVLDGNQSDDSSTLSINDNKNNDVLPDDVLQLTQEREEMIKDFDREINKTHFELQETKDKLKALNDKLFHLIDLKNKKSKVLLRKINECTRNYKSKK
ncbi:unnamed protein product, partial [Rotaria sp. Silwood2]